MRTLIVSDLHLGAPTEEDVLRDPREREPLLAELRGCDRLVLLGDVLELRDAAPGEAMGAARPFFEEVGAALGGGDLVLCAGNHDHALTRPEGSATIETLAGWSQPARLRAAYPGVWVRDDVYATHGHYLDCCVSPTSGERMMLRALLALAQARRAAQDGRERIASWEAAAGLLYPRLDRRQTLRRLATSRVMGALGRRVSGVRGFELVLAERRAMGEVAALLGIEGAHVIFGHTHRAGPMPGEEVGQWRGPLGVRLLNCGCWLDADRGGQAGRDEPHRWRGSCVIVEDDRPPLVVRLPPGGDPASGRDHAPDDDHAPDGDSGSDHPGRVRR
ncbi:MAG: metallophosphoesterase [Solirubrobacteraceae bacterium]